MAAGPSAMPDRDGLEGGEAMEPLETLLAPEARLPGAAERRLDTARVVLVDIDLPGVDVARKLLDDQWLGISTHDPKQIAAAAANGADYVGFGPCFPTATKGYEHGKSSDEIEAAVAASRTHGLPLFAIGGITAERLPGLRVIGVDRIAVSSAILAADDPRAAAQALRRML
jgi:thiamine-phosphate pyrophosphorylase